MLPPWLDVGFMEGVLKKSENDQTIEVKKLTTKFATATGDHYFSDMIRACVEYSCSKSDDRKSMEKISLIIKVEPSVENPRKKLILDSGVFGIEIRMMETLAKMEQLLSEDGYHLKARALHTDAGDPSLLILEDLTSLGYRIADRNVGLDHDHCVLVMRGLAKFHASSVALYEKDPKITEYTRGVFHTKVHEKLEKFFENGLKVFAKEILDWPELGSNRISFSEKILKLSDVFFGKGSECYKPKPDEFNVLNHGDCWFSNMLFRYNDENRVVDHIFVDFQMCCWTTPLMDILMFLNTSTTEDVELNSRDALLEEYLECLTKTMWRIGCKTSAPQIADLKRLRPEHEVLSMMASCVGLPIMFGNEKNQSKSIDEIYEQSDTSFDTSVYKNPEYRRRMLRRLRAWNANGVFEI